MQEDFKDYYLDSQLNIKTTGRNDDFSDTHRYPYEPTSYSVLERIIESELITKNDVVLDYGCGMGRVPVFLNNKIGCNGIGIEMVPYFYNEALHNKASYKKGEQINFLNCLAENYEVPEEVSVCFFFNPFDIGIMRGVLKRILASYYKNQRTIKLFFYYPQDEYLQLFDSVYEMTRIQDIDCMDLFAKNDERNKVVVYEIGER